MALEWRRSCIRKADHSGPHRNKMAEWTDADFELTLATNARVKKPTERSAG